MLSKIGRTCGLAVGAVLSVAALAQSATAETAADFYKGKTVTLIVASAAGGFADTIARAFAPEFEKHIPGHPQIIVQNKPGAGGLVGAAMLQHAAPHDGSMIGFLLGNDLTTPLILKSRQFDPRKVQWIGSIRNGDYPYAFYTYKSAPVQSAADLFDQKKKIVVGSTSYTQFNRIFPAILNKYTGTNIHDVSGYKGSGEVYLALERGEVGGWIEGSHAILAADNKAGQMVKAGELKPVLLFASKKVARFPNIPVAGTYIKGKKQQQVADFYFRASATGRPIAVPEGVPADRVKALRDAFDATMSDPAAVAQIKKQVNTSLVESIDAADVSDMVKNFYATDADALAEVRSFVKK